MDELRRFDVMNGNLIPAQDGRSCHFVDAYHYFTAIHLADKTAALEALAEGHRAANEVKDAGRDRELDRVVDHWTNLLLQEQTKHAAELAALRGEGEPALIRFEHPQLIGEPCMIHRGFRPEMELLCSVAAVCAVDLWVTHSMRPLDQELVDPIVKAAKRSNHHAGSAVDLNPVYNGLWYTSKMMAGFECLPRSVQKFLSDVTLDPDLRWGGQFGINKDRVHFDSDLARRDPAEWQRRVEQLAEES